MSHLIFNEGQVVRELRPVPTMSSEAQSSALTLRLQFQNAFDPNDQAAAPGESRYDGTTLMGSQTLPPLPPLPIDRQTLSPLPPLRTPFANMLPSAQFHAQALGRHSQPYFDTTGQISLPGLEPRVTATLWEDEGTLCYVVRSNGVAVAKREDNQMINGTNLLNVAGMTRSMIDDILASEQRCHVVFTGPDDMKGVWIPFDRALLFANVEGITGLLYPLFVHNIAALFCHLPNNRLTHNYSMGAFASAGMLQPPRQLAPIDHNAFRTPPTSTKSSVRISRSKAIEGDMDSSESSQNLEFLSRQQFHGSRQIHSKSSYTYPDGPLSQTTIRHDALGPTETTLTGENGNGGERAISSSQHDECTVSQGLLPPSQGPSKVDSVRRKTYNRRLLLSCTKCRERKVKCDRTKPCGACCARGHPNKCEFITAEVYDNNLVQQSYEIRRLRQENDELKKRLASHDQFLAALLSSNASPRSDYSLKNEDEPTKETLNLAHDGIVEKDNAMMTSRAIKRFEQIHQKRTTILNKGNAAMLQIKSEFEEDTHHHIENESSASTDTASVTAPFHDFTEADDHSLESDGLSASIRSIVEDLQCRVDKLLRKTDIQRICSSIPSTEISKLARHQILLLISGSKQRRAVGSSSDSCLTPRWQGSEENTLSAFSHLHRRGSPSAQSDTGVLQNLPTRPTQRNNPRFVWNSRDPRIRARSEPPQHRLESVSSTVVSIGSRTHFYAGEQPVNDGYGGQDNSSRPEGSSQKRKGRNDEADKDYKRDRSSMPNGKRRKIIGSELQKARGRFPCIFHAGEPDQYPSHTKKYEYLAQLLRHLKSHNFFACSKCFSKFEDCITCDAHDQHPCAKSCTRKNCKRHVAQGFERSLTCQCVTSSEEQWRELFRLQYPSTAIPTISDEEPVQFVPTNDYLQEESNNEDVGASGIFNLAVSSFVDDTVDIVEPSIEYPNAHGANTVQIDGSFMNDIQSLRQRVQLLEQRFSQPTERESDLEMVLGNVWQALVRTGSSDAQPESPVWRLVRRFARNILSTTTEPAVVTQEHVGESRGPADLSTNLFSEDWMDMFNDPSMVGPSKGSHSDSGYRTGV